MPLLELNSDQRREIINTQQRFQARREAADRVRSFRGSMVWSDSKGHVYLLRSGYAKDGRRRQVSLGPRNPETERMKIEFDRGRREADIRLSDIETVLERQAAVNRALGLGRIPLLGARIIRALDANNLLGAGLRVLGTYALYAYEAVAGVRLDTSLTTTEDIDLLFDTRARLSFVRTDEVEDRSLLRILQRVDRSFQRSREDFRAINRDGYMVDLIRPLRNPPWTAEASQIGTDPTDLVAVEIGGLEWMESAPPFEATVIDDRGAPLRLVTVDPRVFAIHKNWLSARFDRDPLKRRRDAEQATAIASLVTTHMPHLAFANADLQMVPLPLFDAARPLFVQDPI